MGWHLSVNKNLSTGRGELCGEGGRVGLCVMERWWDGGRGAVRNGSRLQGTSELHLALLRGYVVGRCALTWGGGEKAAPRGLCRRAPKQSKAFGLQRHRSAESSHSMGLQGMLFLKLHLLAPEDAPMALGPFSSGGTAGWDPHSELLSPEPQPRLRSAWLSALKTKQTPSGP